MDKFFHSINWPYWQKVGTLWGGRLLAALLIFLIGKWIAGRLARLLKAAMVRTGSDPILVNFLGTTIFGVLLVLVIVSALSTLGVPSASLVAAIGAAGLAIGLALQGSLSNLASGVLLVLFRPFRVGDYIDVGGKGGTVDYVGLMFTRLVTPDNCELSLPNSQVTGAAVTNYSARATRRLDLTISIAYGSETGKVLGILREVLARDARVLKEPPPELLVINLDDASVDIAVRPWCQRGDYWPLRSDLLRAIKDALTAAGIKTPLPQRIVQVANPPS